jgi:hypothetical protein
MAFFSDTDMRNYFGVFYYIESNGEISGALHELSGKQFRFFSTCYQLAAMVVFLIFFLNAILFSMTRIGGVAWCADAWKFFLLASPVPLVSLALYIAGKPKRALSQRKLEIKKTPSISVYITVIFSFLSVILTSHWMSLIGERIAGEYIWAAFFVFVSLLCAFRIASIIKM